jgi:hypothetical protein
MKEKTDIKNLSKEEINKLVSEMTLEEASDLLKKLNEVTEND